jgi:RNA polymerase sigma-70 factor (sigma-E family)
VTSASGTVRGADASAGPDIPFEPFAQAQLAPLARLAYLLTGDHGAADDLTAETLLAAWNQWDRVGPMPNRNAYVRGILVNLAAGRIRSLVRERRRMRLFSAATSEVVPPRDTAAVLDVRTALQSLAPRRRTCVVLRLAFDLSEREVADLLHVSVGTVKSQTSRGVAQLQRMLALGGDDDDA